MSAMLHNVKVLTPHAGGHIHARKREDVSQRTPLVPL